MLSGGERFPAARPKSLELVALMQRRNLDPAGAELVGELAHDRLLAMDDEGGLDPAHAPAPGDQLGLVGMGGEAVYGVDRGADLDLLAEHRDMLGAVDDPPRQRPRCGIADEDHAGFRP